MDQLGNILPNTSFFDEVFAKDANGKRSANIKFEFDLSSIIVMGVVIVIAGVLIKKI